MVKNQYLIVLKTENTKLFYNEEFNVFSTKHGTIYTNKKKALEKMTYAKRYGTTIQGKFEVVRK